MDHLSRTSLGFWWPGPLEEERGLKERPGERWSRLRQEWMGDQVTSISLLTAAMEINNVIGHALEETPSRIKEPLLLPPCVGMKSLKDGV